MKQANPNTQPAACNTAAAELAAIVSRQTTVRCNELLAGRTTLRVGGPADLYVEPASESDLAQVVRFCAERSIPWFVLGRGSNLLVKDGGFRGLVISLSQLAFTGIKVVNAYLHCGAGARLKAIAHAARQSNLSGLEFMEGIPGSLGGGLRMNAGAMGRALSDVLERVRVMNTQGVIKDLRTAELEISYRSCRSLGAQIAVSAILQGKPEGREEIDSRMDEFSRKRWASQPAAPSAGCIFKNPTSVPAGKLIDELGLKGAHVGKARVSAEHGNFIVNDGGATARDILDLIELIRSRARQERGLELETEVEILGE